MWPCLLMVCLRCLGRENRRRRLLIIELRRLVGVVYLGRRRCNFGRILRMVRRL